MAEEQAVNGALAIIEIAQKIFQDKIMTDHGLQELTELESQINLAHKEMKDFETWLHSGPPASRVNTGIGLAERLALLMKRHQSSLEKLAEDFGVGREDKTIREKAWVRFKDAAKHLARGAAGTPGVAVNETKSLTAKLRDANKELRDHMAGVEGTNT